MLKVRELPKEQINESTEHIRYPVARRSPEGYIVIFFDENYGIVIYDKNVECKEEETFKVGDVSHIWVSCNDFEDWTPVKVIISDDLKVME